jgi:hypothetical protein
MPREVVLILGMHRSGTSSIAGTLGKLSLRLPNDLMGGFPGNVRGFFESNSGVALNERILAAAGSIWRDWRPVDPHWFRSRSAEQFKAEVRAQLLSDYENAPQIVLKDPRICRLAPLFIAALEELEYQIKVIIPFRNPLEVCESLLIRDGIPMAVGMMIWLRHVLDAEYHSRKFPRVFLNWHEFLGDWRPHIREIAEKLGIALPVDDAGFGLDIDEFLSGNLKHHNHTDESVLSDARVPAPVLCTFRALLNLAINPRSSGDIVSLSKMRRRFNLGTMIFEAAVAGLEKEIEGVRTRTTELYSAIEVITTERNLQWILTGNDAK